MSGAAPAFRDMIAAMNNGGKIAILGIRADGLFGIDWNKVIFKMLTLKGIYGREMYETWYKMIAFIQGGLDISPIITHRLPIEPIPRRLRSHAQRQFRQGGAGLECLTLLGDGRTFLVAPPQHQHGQYQRNDSAQRDRRQHRKRRAVEERAGDRYHQRARHHLQRAAER